MRALILSIVLSLPTLTWGAPAVLFDEVEVKEVPEAPTYQDSSPQRRQSRKLSPETRITPLSQRTSLKDIYSNQEFNSVFEMRAKRRVGVGAQTAGTTGLFGVLVELNLTPSSSAVVAYGGGPDYNAFNFQYKNIFGGRNISPYAGIGYARWYNSARSGNIGQTSPGILGSRFLTEDEKRSGEFAIDMITPNIGIQYSQLFGAYTGTSFFAEVNFLTPTRDLTPVPTGAVGALYYF